LAISGPSNLVLKPEINGNEPKKESRPLLQIPHAFNPDQNLLIITVY